MAESKHVINEAWLIIPALLPALFPDTYTCIALIRLPSWHEFHAPRCGISADLFALTTTLN
ncbi:MAG TPA: hypothetical protein VHJ19_02570, partial [Gammaproteobacteria bacterium]|nr:hypothetical protein [Gammaproteobacteria bacterium]